MHTERPLASQHSAPAWADGPTAKYGTGSHPKAIGIDTVRNRRSSDRPSVFLPSVSQIRRGTSPELPPFAAFGPGSEIVEPFVVSCPSRIVIGEGVRIGERSWLSVVDFHNGRSYEPRLSIGDGARLGPDLVIACIGSVEIGAKVQTGPRVFIGDTYHDYHDPDTAIVDQLMADPRPVRIETGAFLGIGSAVLPGVTVGARACVAAGAVVTRDVPPNSLAAGNPARIVRQWDPALRIWRELSGDEVAPPRALGSEAAPSELDNRAALAEAHRRSAEEEVRILRLRNEQSLGRLEGLERERDELERWLTDHRQSISWRLTRPLRAAKRLVVRTPD
jgi:acetyltransferase-like isoleucine patch superfamily enzyme